MENPTEYAVLVGSIEVRRRGGGGRTLTGSFPYSKLAVRADSGRVRKERFCCSRLLFRPQGETRGPSTLGPRVLQASGLRRAGSLRLSDSAKALSFEATIPATAEQPTWIRDTVMALDAGLVGGISPGFRVPPINGAEVLIPEPGNEGVMIREIREAVLFELSLVTRPAYGDTTVSRREAEAVYPEPDPEEEERWLLL